jgi:hypothetical protein
MRTMLLLALALSACLAACGGDDTPPGTDDTVASAAVTPQGAQPITHTFEKAGTYTLRATGTYQAAPAAGGDTLNVWFSFSGQGTLSGNAEPTYTTSSVGAVSIDETVTVTLDGDGPWQVTVLCATGNGSGTISNLNLHTSPH